MLRKALGSSPVSIRKYDTPLFGETMRRRVALSVFYPSAEWETECPYKDPDWQKAAHERAGTPAMASEAAVSALNNGIHTFCGDGSAPLSDEKEKYPVILFSHGLCSYEMESTVLCADLASLGNVVVSVGHPRGSKIVTYTDGSIYEDTQPFKKLRHELDTVEPIWYEDFLAAIDLLHEMNRTDPMWKDRLEMNGIGIVGSSFGGCCGIAAALKNEKIRYAVNLDGGLFVPMMYTFPDKPILVLCSPMNFLAHSALARHGCTNVEIKKYRKIVHYEFSDGVYLGPKGKANREWADRTSRERAERILEFIGRIGSST